jgi:hypothetical protein
MTSQFRFFAALAISAVALLGGWFAASSTPDAAPAPSTREWRVTQQGDAEDIDRFVQQILQSDLFPEARLRDELEPASAPPIDTAEGLAAALGDPSLTALVRRGDVWRIHLYGAFEGSQVREVGDQLADGWLIVAIEPAAVILERGEDSRRIDVFEAEQHTE